METIKLYATPDGWIADFVDSARIRELFGSTQLPMAFTSRAPGAVVKAAIEKLNPGVRVILA